MPHWEGPLWDLCALLLEHDTKLSNHLPLETEKGTLHRATLSNAPKSLILICPNCPPITCDWRKDWCFLKMNWKFCTFPAIWYINYVYIYIYIYMQYTYIEFHRNQRNKRLQRQSADWSGAVSAVLLPWYFCNILWCLAALPCSQYSEMFFWEMAKEAAPCEAFNFTSSFLCCLLTMSLDSREVLTLFFSQPFQCFYVRCIELVDRIKRSCRFMYNIVQIDVFPMSLYQDILQQTCDAAGTPDSLDYAGACTFARYPFTRAFRWAVRTHLLKYRNNESNSTQLEENVFWESKPLNSYKLGLQGGIGTVLIGEVLVLTWKSLYSY